MRDRLNGVVGARQQYTRPAHTTLQQIFLRRNAGLFLENRGKVAAMDADIFRDSGNCRRGIIDAEKVYRVLHIAVSLIVA